jgi:hypothetical protein
MNRQREGLLGLMAIRLSLEPLMNLTLCEVFRLITLGLMSWLHGGNLQMLRV